jgi:uncharacterized membrane protein
MTIDPIMVLHMAAALLALALGVVNLLGPKGTRRHKAVGWVWIAAMLGVTLPSFDLTVLNPGQFSWIHGLSIVSLITMGASMWAIRAGRVQTHKRMMIGLMLGLTIAGIFTLAPDRFIGALLGIGHE